MKFGLLVLSSVIATSRAFMLNNRISMARNIGRSLLLAKDIMVTGNRIPFVNQDIFEKSSEREKREEDESSRYTKNRPHNQRGNEQEVPHIKRV